MMMMICVRTLPTVVWRLAASKPFHHKRCAIFAVKSCSPSGRTLLSRYVPNRSHKLGKTIIVQAFIDAMIRLTPKKCLDNMPDISYCPSCDSVVVIDSSDGGLFGQCPACQFAFCTKCSAPWHGTANVRNKPVDCCGCDTAN